MITSEDVTVHDTAEAGNTGRSLSSEERWERRTWARVPFCGRAIVTRTNKRAENATIRDISARALYLETSVEIGLLELVGLRLFLGEATSEFGGGLRGVVVRRDLAGVVVRLLGLDFDSYMLLGKVIARAAGEDSNAAADFLDSVRALDPSPSAQHIAAIEARYRLVKEDDACSGVEGGEDALPFPWHELQNGPPSGHEAG